MSRGLLVAMEAVSKTVVYARESSKNPHFGDSNKSLPRRHFSSSIMFLKGKDRVSVLNELQQVTMTVQFSFYWNTELLRSLSS